MAEDENDSEYVFRKLVKELQNCVLDINVEKSHYMIGYRKKI